MIILRSRSLIIPNDEYNLGNDYDTNTATRVFQLDRVMEGIDLANLMFKLDLTYADGTSDTLALDSEVTDDKINLTWTVTKNQLHVPGTVVVQIRALNVDGNMKWTSYIGAFFVEASMFGSADYSGKLTEVEQFEVAIKSEKERVQNEKARQDAEAERVQAEAERKSAEEERKTAESERKSAETVRSNAETARESAETEREEWYNSAKTNFDAAIASGDKAERIANSLETNVETSMKAAAASATAAAGSASAAAGSANEAKQYSQNWSALDQRVTKNAADIVTTNNNLSNQTDRITQLYSDLSNFVVARQISADVTIPNGSPYSTSTHDITCDIPSGYKYVGILRAWCIDPSCFVCNAYFRDEGKNAKIDVSNLNGTQKNTTIFIGVLYAKIMI